MSPSHRSQPQPRRMFGSKIDVSMGRPPPKLQSSLLAHSRSPTLYTTSKPHLNLSIINLAYDGSTGHLSHRCRQCCNTKNHSLRHSPGLRGLSRKHVFRFAGWYGELNAHAERAAWLCLLRSIQHHLSRPLSPSETTVIEIIAGSLRWHHLHLASHHLFPPWSSWQLQKRIDRRGSALCSFFSGASRLADWVLSQELPLGNFFYWASGFVILLPLLLAY